MMDYGKLKYDKIECKLDHDGKWHDATPKLEITLTARIKEISQ